MKRSIVFFTLLFSVILIRAQEHTSHPIAWQYTVKKTADRTYEVHLTAQLASGWHAYSQQQPKDAVAQPTEIHFNPNPLLHIAGKIKEVGNMERWKDEASGIMANQYADHVDFVQVVKLKTRARTAVTGSLTYQVCTNEMCLPPKTEPFSIPIGE